MYFLCQKSRTLLVRNIVVEKLQSRYATKIERERKEEKKTIVVIVPHSQKKDAAANLF